MENKKFSDLVVGDKVYLKIDETIETYCIKEIENVKNAFNYGQTDLGMEVDEYLKFINLR